jgi:hypothetical protein
LGGLISTLPILGNDWYFYIDEAGSPDVTSKGDLFCFTGIAIPGSTVDGFKKTDDFIGNRKGIQLDIADLESLRDCLLTSKAYIVIGRLELRDATLVGRIKKRYNKLKIRLKSEDRPTVANYIWLQFFIFNIIELWRLLIEKSETVVNIFIYFNEKTLKSREGKILNYFGIKELTQEMRKVTAEVNDEVKYEVMKTSNTRINCLQSLSRYQLEIKIADAMVVALENIVWMRKSIFLLNFSNVSM